MPSDSIAGFLDHAKASKVLFHEQVEQLIRQPDVPQSDLAALCEYLLGRGVVTRFQADAIRDGRSQDLTFGSYPIIDALGPCPGGTAFRALHPSLRTPLVLRKLDPDAFAPHDTAAEVVNRARTFGTLPHPNLLALLDAGVVQGQPYAVLEPPTDAAPLDALLMEIGGAMPGFLAAEYGRAIASALKLVHDRGGWHGEVRPGLLLVGPLTLKTGPDGTVRRRPAHNATARLTETGLIPRRGPVGGSPPAADVLAYLPPERLDGYGYDARGDIYGLGATLYLLLAGRPPHAAADELVEQVRSAAPVPLATLRPDVPADLAAAVMTMMAKRPEDRPRSAADVEALLAPFCRPGTAVPEGVIPMASPASSVALASAVPEAVPVAEPVEPIPVAVAVAVAVEPPEPDGWGVGPNAFADAREDDDDRPRQRRQKGMSKGEKGRALIWMIVGACLHLTAIALLVLYLTGNLNFDSDEKKEKKGPTQPSQPQQRTRSGGS